MKSRETLHSPRAALAAAARSARTLDTAGNHGGQFTPVKDSRNRRVPGLYVRNGRFYAQLWVDRGDGRKTARRFPLATKDGEAVRTLQQAKEAAEIKRHERRENALPIGGRKPLFTDYIETYFAKAKVQRKRAGTLENEAQAIGRWKEHLGHVRIDRITAPMISAFVEKRLGGGKFGGRELKPVAERTANLDLLMLRNVLKAALDDGHLRELPKMKALDEPPAPKRGLLTPAEFEGLLTAARAACERNGAQLADYLLFLAYSGAREQEALRVKWRDVDLQKGRVTIGADGLAKNGEARVVEFNAHLDKLLGEMNARRVPDCAWLFPSPQRGSRDIPARSFRESLKMARKAAGLPWVGFHDLRHFFCSACVMAGIDFMTIAAWLGHKDGGILVGKVYGHLLDEHRAKMAGRLTIGIAAIHEPHAAPT